MRPRFKLILSIVLLLVVYQLAGHLLPSIYTSHYHLTENIDASVNEASVDAFGTVVAKSSLDDDDWTHASDALLPAAASQSSSRLLSPISLPRFRLSQSSSKPVTSSSLAPSLPPLLAAYTPPEQPGSVVIATAVQSGEQSAAIDLIRSVRDRFNASLPLVLWDLGLTTADLMELSSGAKDGLACPSRWCRLRRFRFDLYPEHVSSRLDTRAYKPFAIGALLRRFGVVVWTDLGGPWPAGFSVGMSGLRPVLEDARAAGLQAWSFPPPTTAFTHPQTFELLNASLHDYRLHRMVSAAHLVLAASPFVHRRLLLPWSRCALRPACWLPAGSGRPFVVLGSGCRFGDIRPYFRYSGCHLYDTSALNVVLGRAYDFNVSAYSCDRKVFGYGLNDTDLANHFSIPGVDFDQLERSALPNEYVR
ncbi:hypothetical protein BOX15_Mlig009839g7 [Macrostomum lignano]|uniref:Uncharacterized protein n=4 Tax=Macrostomum lignano TaxID=282301 RepID=A0A267D9K5_9PLAT|nr:hypothetical protein BOX15_Mlig009839g7 [Macrostomum lignano]